MTKIFRIYLSCFLFFSTSKEWKCTCEVLCCAYLVAKGIIFICCIIYYMWICLPFSDLEVRKDMTWLEFLWQLYIDFPLLSDNYLNSLTRLWMWLKLSHFIFHLLLSPFREVIPNKSNTWLQEVIYLSFSETFNSTTFISIVSLQAALFTSTKCLCTISQL